MRKYLQIMPERVHQELSIIEDLLKPEIKGYSFDYLKEVISILACHIPKDDNCTPLKMTYIKILVPQGDKYLLGLVDMGIIQRSGYAIKGQTSFKYNFTSEYRSRYVSVPLLNAKLIRRIEKAQEGLRKEAARTVRSHSDQVKYLRQLTIETEAIEYIERNYKADTHEYNCAKASATRILNGDIFYSKDNTSGRFHSNITNIAKDLRQFLRIKDEPLINIDIKNSQPYLSTIILTNPGKVSWMVENPAFALLLQTLKVSLSEDVKKYIFLVVSGQFYEYLMTEFSKEGLTLTRDETKQQILRVLFARNRMPKDEANRKARQVFIKNFPKVHRIFSKVRGHNRGDKFQNYCRFAILLQRIESYLMLDVILKRIYKELPGVIAVTIHDSVMTGVLSNNVEAVRKIMVDELTSFVGLPPKVKIEETTREKEREEGSKQYSNQYDATTFVTLN